MIKPKTQKAAKAILSILLVFSFLFGMIPAYAASDNTTYRTDKHDNDIMSLTIGEQVYYFASVSDAFSAASDTVELIGDDITLTVLNDAEETFEMLTPLFKERNSVTIDLNGKTLTLMGRKNGEAYSCSLTLYAAETIITDSSATGNAVVEGKETKDTFNSGKLVLDYYGLFVASGKKLTVENIFVDVKTKSSNTFAGTSAEITIKNSTVSRVLESDTVAGRIVSAKTALIEDSSLSTPGTAIEISGTGEIKNCVVSGQDSTVLASKAASVIVEGGVYNNVSTKNGNTHVILKEGVFSGKLDAVTATDVIEVQGGYYLTEQVALWEQATGTVYAPHSTAEQINDGEYTGYTKFTMRPATKATVTLDAMEGAASINQETGNVTVYQGDSMTYEVTCLPGFAVTGITYNNEGVNLTGNVNFAVKGHVYSYTIPEVPANGFTLVITVSEIGTKDVVSVTKDGASETKYKSLAAGLLQAQDNSTVKLLDNIDYDTELVFPVKTLTLDLNGYVLNFRGIEPQSSPSSSYCILMNGGELTLTDSGENGAVSFSTDTLVSGIGMIGDNTKLNITGGTLKDLARNGSCYVVYCNANNGEVNISGGEIQGCVLGYSKSSKLNISGSARLIGVNYPQVISSTGELTISGGELYCESDVAGENAVVRIGTYGSTVDQVAFTMTGGTITNKANGPAVETTGSTTGRMTIKDQAEIVSFKGNAFDIYTHSNKSEIIIGDGARLKGGAYAVYIQEAKSAGAEKTINIEGGAFACGEDYLPISNTYYVNFPADKVLDTQTSNDVTGYYQLADKDALGGTYIPSEGTGVQPQTYTYQDFEGISDGSNYGLKQLLEEVKPVYDSQNIDETYPTEVYKTFTAAYEAANFLYAENRNANQMEINFRAKALSLSYIALTAVSSLDLDNMADGSYTIQVGLWKSNMTTPSMADGAVNHEARLFKKGDTWILSLDFGPTYQYSIYGHLEDFYIYHGTDVNSAKSNMMAESGSEDKNQYKDEATYDNWYAGGNSNEQEFSPDGSGGKDDPKYNLPGTVTVQLPYVGITTELNSYWVGMDVDAMGGYASAILMLSWSTLKEVDVYPTLTVTPSELTMLPGEKQTVTAALKGSVSEGYTVSKWESDNASVATVNNGEITAVGAGTCTITVTATKAGAEDLVKTIKVTVVPEGSAAVDVQNVTSSGSGESAELSGNALLTGGSDRVTVDGNTITFNAKSEGTGITSSKVVIDAETAKALEGKTAVIQTNTGTITLDSALLAKIAAAGGKVTLSISKTDTPDSSLGQFSAAYAISLIDANGKAVDFGSGRATIAVPVSENVSWAYCIADGKRTDRAAVAMNNGTATFTVSHFSVWALSAREYEVGGSESKFFLEDGNYYVDVYLWKEVGNEASMGDIAFRNNRKALVTVKNGKITRVQIATNPVFIDPYYSAIISFKLADGTEVTIEATGELTTSPAGKNYTYIKLVSFDLPEGAQPDIRDAVTYVPVIFYVPDTPMDAAVGEDLAARLRFEWSTATKVEDEKLNPDDDTASDTESVVLKDEKTGIVLETNTGILDKNATLSVDVLTKGSDYDFALRALSDVDAKWSLYNIVTLLNGAKTDPSGAVVLRIPCSNADGYVVYLINADGSKTKLNGSVEDGYFVFRTRSLGLIAVGTANSNGGNGNSVNDNPGNGGNSNGDNNYNLANSGSTQTGDNSDLAVWLLLMLASGAALIVLTLGRKRRDYMGE